MNLYNVYTYNKTIFYDIMHPIFYILQAVVRKKGSRSGQICVYLLYYIQCLVPTPAKKISFTKLI